MPARPLQIGTQARLHIQEAQANYVRYERLAQNPLDIGWALVLLFYSALHLVQAHALAKCPTLSPTSSAWRKVPEDHGERSKYVSSRHRDRGVVHGEIIVAKMNLKRIRMLCRQDRRTR